MAIIFFQCTDVLRSTARGKVGGLGGAPGGGTACGCSVGVASTTDASFVCFDRGHPLLECPVSGVLCVSGPVLALAATDLLAGALNFYFLNP